MDIKLECARCGNTFTVNTVHQRAIGLHQIPNRCPNCCDRIQRRPATKTVVRRELIEEWPNCAIRLPEEWFREFTAQDTDRPCRRAVVKGSMGKGASWEGRIDVYDFRKNPEAPGNVRLMEVEHETGDEREETHYSPVYRYLSIDPSDCDCETPEMALVFASVYRKTTLKGFGRQFHARLDTDRAIWSYRLSSEARSGRFGNEMALAIVTDENPVIGIGTGDVRFETAWTLSNPEGADLRESESPAGPAVEIAGRKKEDQ